MNFKAFGYTALSCICASGYGAVVTPQVDSVSMDQPGPSRLVKIDYTFSGADAVITLDVQTNTLDGAWVSIGGEAVCNATGDVWKRVANDGATHHIEWRPDLSWPGHIVAEGGARAVVTAWSLDNTPDYMAVDISLGAQQNTQKYYQGADFVPGGVTNPAYKTSKLLMRKIMAKDVEWTMGASGVETQRWSDRDGTLQVSLTNNYYIGIYPVTQSQWKEVSTNSTTSANFTAEGAMRPMEHLCYNEIRNSSTYLADTSHDWPNPPHPSSFIGLLRARSGLDFDLPSGAQWEFAARSGHGSGYWNDGSEIKNTNYDANLHKLARYLQNNPIGQSITAACAPADGGTPIVGSYNPSSWGIYDMCGNVWEYVLDWYEGHLETQKDVLGSPYAGRVNIDPSSPQKTLSGATGTTRETRGGSIIYNANLCRPSFRNFIDPAYRNVTDVVGFRVVCTAGLQ